MMCAPVYALQFAKFEEKSVIKRLTLLAIRLFFIWFFACSVAWIGGAYMYAFFNSISYFPGWYDVKSIIKISSVISAVFIIVVCVSVRW